MLRTCCCAAPNTASEEVTRFLFGEHGGFVKGRRWQRGNLEFSTVVHHIKYLYTRCPLIKERQSFKVWRMQSPNTSPSSESRTSKFSCYTIVPTCCSKQGLTADLSLSSPTSAHQFDTNKNSYSESSLAH